MMSHLDQSILAINELFVEESNSFIPDHIARVSSLIYDYFVSTCFSYSKIAVLKECKI